MEKLMLFGMGSPSDQKKFDETTVDGKTIDDFLHAHGVKVYHHPDNDQYLQTSIHRTTMMTLDYTEDLEGIADSNRLVVGMAGGLALAMPGVAAADASQVPILSVGFDHYAFENIYPIPDGTGLGVVPSVAKAAELGAKILNLEDMPVQVVLDDRCKGAEGFIKMLKRFIPQYEGVGELKDKYEGLLVCLSNNPGFLTDIDKKADLAVLGLGKGLPAKAMEDRLPGLYNSIVVGRPNNVALFAARIVATYDKSVGTNLALFREQEADKYPKYKPIMVEHFK